MKPSTEDRINKAINRYNDNPEKYIKVLCWYQQGLIDENDWFIFLDTGKCYNA